MNSSSAAPSVLVSWHLRDEPLAPIGVAARGAAARVLARRLLQRDDETLQKLEGISAGEWLIFRGAAENLPWADGAIYLGRAAVAPTLLLPTLWRSAPNAALLQRALKNRFGSSASLAIIPPCAHRKTAQNSLDEALQMDAASQINFAAPQNENNAPQESMRVLASAPDIISNAPTLIFPLGSARRVARAPLENWLRAQGEKPPAAPFPTRILSTENDTSNGAASREISPIGDSRLNETSPRFGDVENAHDEGENR